MLKYIEKLLINVVVIGIILIQQGYAQNKSKMSTMLGVGDSLPSVNIKIDQYPTTTVNLSELKGKLIILDFWTISCSSCIASMPMMEELQKAFEDQIQIILVTPNSADQVTKLKQRSKLVSNIKLPFIVNDSLLYPNLPINTVPAHVWIDKDGKIQYITNGRNTTMASIEAYLKGEDVKLPVKNELKDVDFDQPLWIEGNGRHLDKMLYYSYLTKRIESGSSRVSVAVDKSIGLVTNFKGFNQPALSLLKIAFGKKTLHSYGKNNRFTLNVKDSAKFLAPISQEDRDDWRKNNTYCYELKVQSSHADSFFEMMQQDLERYFRVTGRLEKQRKLCWVITATSKVNKVKTAGGDFVNRIYRSLSFDEAHLQNMPITFLTEVIESIGESFQEDLPPILDETGYSGNIDIRIDNRPGSLKKLRKDLAVFGLNILEEEREIDVLVIEDKR